MENIVKYIYIYFDEKNNELIFVSEYIPLNFTDLLKITYNEK